jgi:hypothetical protein
MSARDLVGHARQHPVGEAGDRVLFVDDHRPPQQGRHHAARKGDVAAHAEHHIGPHATDLRQRLGKALQQVEGQQQLAQQPLAPQRGEAHPGDLVAAGRDDARLHAIRVAHPDDLPAPLAQRIGHREARVDVAAGTAGHDHQGGHQALPPRKDSF